MFNTYLRNYIFEVKLKVRKILKTGFNLLNLLNTNNQTLKFRLLKHLC
jgi:hypothetical protein